MILVWLILIPFLGGILSWQAERWGGQAPRWIALGTMLFVLVISVILWLGGDFSLPGRAGNQAVTPAPATPAPVDPANAASKTRCALDGQRR